MTIKNKNAKDNEYSTIKETSSLGLPFWPRNNKKH